MSAEALTHHMSRLNPSPSRVTVPRLAIVSDVVPVRAAGGELLLHRLFSEWPRDRLLVVEGNVLPSDPALRLPGVRYDRVPYYAARATRSRFRRHWNGFALLGVRGRGRAVRSLLTGFRPEAILTVAHGHLWLAAGAAARALRAPLHVIVHDRWESMTPMPAWAAGAARRAADDVFAHAASLLCVSPTMADGFRRRFGESSTTLYPNRGDDSPTPKVRVRRSPGRVAAFAGSIWSGEYADQIAELAHALAAEGGHVDLYTKQSFGTLEAIPNVHMRGFLPPHELAERLGATADLLFAPMPFSSGERELVSTSFPSKLADYTAVGLPILICGPDYCSAARWAAEHPGVAAVVNSPAREAIGPVLRNLFADPARREEMARRAIEVGERCFSPAAARKRLSDIVANSLTVTA